MLAAGIKSPVPLEELESHLREEFERQLQAGLSGQFAFDAAVRDIGQGAELKTEFAKGRRLMSLLETELVKKEWELKWWPVLHFILFTGIFIFFSSLVLFRFGSFAEATSLERSSSLAAMVVSYLLLVAGLFGYKFFPVIPDKRARLAIGVCSVTVVAFSVMIFLIQVNLNIQQFLMEFVWVFFVPFGALGGLILGLERAARKKVKTASS